jgi:hypothetical protein
MPRGESQYAGRILCHPRREKLRTLHAQARQQRESLWRDRMWADAMLAQRDPTVPLH